MLSGQLSNGLVEVVVPGTTETLGYVFTEPSGAGQLQRWLLYRAPSNHFELAAPPREMERWTLSDWQSNVPSLWRRETFYVWAQTDVYSHGRVYGGVRWDRIPATLPDPTYPRQGGDFQLDPTGYHVAVTQWTTNLWGMAYTEQGLSDAVGAGRSRNAEYWLLPRGFEPAGQSRTTVSAGSIPVSSRERFVELANGLWAPGAIFAITGCKTYFGDEAPVEP